MAKRTTVSASPEKDMAQAVREFFIDGYDPLGQHKTPSDLAFSMLLELDLLNEGEENELTTPAKVARAKRFVEKWRSSEE